jgi:hypothetical protein
LLTPTANVGRSTATAAQSPFLETVLQLSFGGLHETHSSFFGLDGTDYTVSLSGVQRASPSLDWVQEFRVVDGPFAGDNGRNLGSVVNTITKSGTNNLHGSLYEYFRNDALDAENALSAPGLNTLRVNQFGGSLDGPIRRDKTFYFVGYEGQRRAASPTFSTFILGCLDNPGCMGPGTPSINQVKEQFGLQPEQLNSILQIDNYDKAMDFRSPTAQARWVATRIAEPPTITVIFACSGSSMSLSASRRKPVWRPLISSITRTCRTSTRSTARPIFSVPYLVNTGTRSEVRQIRHLRRQTSPVQPGN